MLKKYTAKGYRYLLSIKQKHSFFTLVFLMAAATASAQAVTEKVQMADGLRSNGKIFVVVAVLLTVLTGLILYLVKLDKKISRLEKERQV